MDTNLDAAEMKKSLGEPLRLLCKITGIPEPDIQWFKNDALITNDQNDTRISIYEDKTMLDIKFMKIEDEGEFKCVGTNRIGSAEMTTNLKITSKSQRSTILFFYICLTFYFLSDMPKISLSWIIGIAALILVLIICTVYLSIRFRRERRVRLCY